MMHVAVLKGGPSAEAEVSRVSAQQVAQGLERKGYQTTLVELDEQCVNTLSSLSPDVVFPALHGPPGEDGTVQGFLEIMGLPYVGSPVRGSALAMDKAVAKLIFTQAQLPVLSDLVVSHQLPLAEQARAVRDQLGDKVAIKPLSQGSALGVKLLPAGGDIEQALSEATQFGDCLVEPFVEGLEITAGVLELDGELIAHPVIEIETAQDTWYDFDNRYKAGASEHIIPARLPAGTSQQIQDIAIRAHQALGLRDLSRADFIVTASNDIYLLEVNTLPGMTPTSLYPDGAAHIGYAFDDLMDALVQQAAKR